jgi:hypothetical protein
MKSLRFLLEIGCCLALCGGIAAADSIQLRNGRHLQGKYIGGTTTAIGFMTGGTIEYFATTEVLVLMFDNGTDAPLSELKPNPMKAKPQAQGGIPQVRRINASSPNRLRQPKPRPVVSAQRVHPKV